MRTILDARARNARELIAYLNGETDTHPQGKSGEKWIIPPQESKKMWDTAPEVWVFSEFNV